MLGHLFEQRWTSVDVHVDKKIQDYVMVTMVSLHLKFLK